ncbi:MAG: hypothetical protein V7K25_16450 [Nostoc sp.]|uniref:hypothetical protein n=1 Tax=Nostoc sp. TaxID=1180 RepID=UPI002FFA25B4
MFTDFGVIAEIYCAIALNPTSHQRISSLANSSTLVQPSLEDFSYETGNSFPGGCWDSRSIANRDVYDGLRLCNFHTARSLLLQHEPLLILPRDMCNQSPQEFYQLQFIL